MPIPSELETKLRPHLRPQIGPGRGGFTGITLAGVAEAAGFWHVTPRYAMNALLRHGIWPLRFARNRGVFSADDQAALLASGAAVIGCGGLGGHVATLLARAGVGSLSLCDHDSFDETNLNRQALSREADVGKNKAVAAADEVRAIASHVETRVFAEAATADSLPAILRGCDVVVDCLDSIAARLTVEAAAHAAGMTMIHGSLAGEEGFVMASRPGGEGLRRIYGDAVPYGGGAERVLGVPTLTPAVTAAWEAKLAIDEILGREDDAPGTLRHIDLAIWGIEFLTL